MTPRESFWSVVRNWEAGILWRLEWMSDEDLWALLPCPPWEALA